MSMIRTEKIVLGDASMGFELPVHIPTDYSKRHVQAVARLREIMDTFPFIVDTDGNPWEDSDEERTLYFVGKRGLKGPHISVHDTMQGIRKDFGIIFGLQQMGDGFEVSEFFPVT